VSNGLQYVVLIIAFFLFVVALLLLSRNHNQVKCTQATITWHEFLDRTDLPRSPRPPVVIKDPQRLDELVKMFLSAKSQSFPPAGWATCIIIKFDFSCGHSDQLDIDNELKWCNGLGSPYDMRVPPGFEEVFKSEFGLMSTAP